MGHSSTANRSSSWLAGIVLREVIRAEVSRAQERHLRSLIVAHPDPSVLWNPTYPRDVAAMLDAQQVGVTRLPTPSDAVKPAAEQVAAAAAHDEALLN
jgi:hypothetical protein